MSSTTRLAEHRMREPFGVALLGYGYWGKNLARNVTSHPDLDLSWVVDPDPAQLERAAAVFPTARTGQDPSPAIEDPHVGVVIVATPLVTHYELASEALEKGRHVVVTKPLADTSQRAYELARFAREQSLILLVDHTFVYTGAVETLRSLASSGELGELVYCSSMRVNLGTYRRDSDVMWDLVPHDLSILGATGYVMPEAVAATAGGRMGGQVDQIAHITLRFPGGFLAQISVSWLSPVKMRLMLIGGTRKMLVYDDLAPSEKIRVYDKGVHLDHGPTGALPAAVEYRLGDMWAPRLDEGEALYKELSHLVECIRKQTPPATGADDAAVMIEVLEAAQVSARERDGAFVAISERSD